MSRLPSLALCAGALLALLAFPQLRDDQAGWAARLALALTLVGALGAGVHGLRLQPGRTLLLHIAEPRFAWPAVLGGGALLWSLSP